MASLESGPGSRMKFVVLQETPVNPAALDPAGVTVVCTCHDRPFQCSANGLVSSSPKPPLIAVNEPPTAEQSVELAHDNAIAGQPARFRDQRRVADVDAVERADGFARVFPQHKYEIVKALHNSPEMKAAIPGTDPVYVDDNGDPTIVKPGGPHVIFGRGEACPDDIVTAFLEHGTRPDSRRTVCPGDVADDYVPLPPLVATYYASTKAALRSADDERRVHVTLTAAGRKLKSRAVKIPACILAASQCSLGELVSLNRQIRQFRERLLAAQTTD